MTVFKEPHINKSLKRHRDWGSERRIAQNGRLRKTGSEKSVLIKNQGLRKECGRGAEGKCGR